MSQAVEDAIHAERRRVFWQQFRRAAAGVAADPSAAAEEQAEVASFDGTLLDGLDSEGIPRVSTRPQRGDIWHVDFGRPMGREEGAGSRPAVVMSTDAFNDSGAGLAILAPLTTAQRGYPSRVKIRPGTSGLKETSWAAVEHLRSVSVLRLREYREAWSARSSTTSSE